jgi:hypothetical protein
MSSAARLSPRRIDLPFRARYHLGDGERPAAGQTRFAIGSLKRRKS